MKMMISKTLLGISVTALTLFGCTSSDEQTDATALNSEPLGESTVLTDDTQPLSDNAYENMFEDVNTEQYDILTLAKMNPNLSTFVQLLEVSGLAPSLAVADPVVTVMIPTNEAFQKLSVEEVNNLMDPANRADLIRLLQYHILPNVVLEREYQTNQVLPTAGGSTMVVDVDVVGNQRVVYVGGAKIVKPDVRTSNGLIHVVDAVIVPEAGAE